MALLGLQAGDRPPSYAIWYLVASPGLLYHEASRSAAIIIVSNSSSMYTIIHTIRLSVNYLGTCLAW